MCPSDGKQRCHLMSRTMNCLESAFPMGIDTMPEFHFRDVSPRVTSLFGWQRNSIFDLASSHEIRDQLRLSQRIVI